MWVASEEPGLGGVVQLCLDVAEGGEVDVDIFDDGCSGCSGVGVDPCSEVVVGRGSGRVEQKIGQLD